MASEQMQQLAALFESGREWYSRNNLGLQDVRDICEGLHAARAERKDVTYAEVDAGGIPALWCIPAECDANSVLLHSHAGGSVVFSMHADRKTAGHLAKAAGVRALVLDFRQSPEHKYPAQHEDVETAKAGCSPVARLDLSADRPESRLVKRLITGFDVPKNDPRDVARQIVDAVERGDAEVLADDMTRQIKAALSGPVEALRAS